MVVFKQRGKLATAWVLVFALATTLAGCSETVDRAATGVTPTAPIEAPAEPGTGVIAPGMLTPGSVPEMPGAAAPGVTPMAPAEVPPGIETPTPANPLPVEMMPEAPSMMPEAPSMVPEAPSMTPEAPPVAPPMVPETPPMVPETPPMTPEPPVQPAAPRPNIVMVITDDQGYGDLSFTGNPVLKTPQLDALAEDSVRLTDFHVAPTCAPTRAGLQTGMWQDRAGVWHTITARNLMRTGLVTMGDVFKDAGYATGMFGKWHLGDNYPYRPQDRGYTHVYMHGAGGVGQTPDYWNNGYFDDTYFRNGVPEPAEGFCTDVYFEQAQDFIREQKAAGKPFLAYISTNAPHSPFHSPPEFSGPYNTGTQGVHPNFYGMIANIDARVGDMRQFLEAEGLTENTIFIFTTDNGTAEGEPVFNAGMRGKKSSHYDGGHRVPFFLHWPGGNLTGGRDVAPITAHIDVLPTLMDLTGVAAPEGVTFDGTSLRSILEGQDAGWPDRIIVTDNQRVVNPRKWKETAVMTSRWRLTAPNELYDIRADPGQRRNVANANGAVVERLTEFYDAWWAELSPGFAEISRIHLGNPAENPSTLTSHDWFGSNTVPPWNQGQIRNGPAQSGSWMVNFETAGPYRFELRRWPAEVNVPLTSGLPGGPAIPGGGGGFRTRAGKALNITRARLQVAGLTEQANVVAGAESVVFELDVPAGNATLDATFFTGNNNGQAGPYYVIVEAL